MALYDVGIHTYVTTFSFCDALDLSQILSAFFQKICTFSLAFSPFSCKRIGVNSNIQKRILLLIAIGYKASRFGSSLGATKRTNGELDLKLPKKRYLVH